MVLTKIYNNQHLKKCILQCDLLIIGTLESFHQNTKNLVKLISKLELVSTQTETVVESVTINLYTQQSVKILWGKHYKFDNYVSF